jgi:pimeloyl-ACP methyl ester carboxylesterase
MKNAAKIRNIILPIIFSFLMTTFMLAADAAADPSSRYVEVYGQSIHYFDEGSGPTVILLHGLSADSTIWRENIGPLSERFRVLVPDQIGSGKSDKPLINYNNGTRIDFLRGFMTALGIDKASLVGNSLGGWIAAGFTLEHPEMVEKLVLVDSGGYALSGPLPPSVKRVLNPSTIADTRQAMKWGFYDDDKFVTEEAVLETFRKKLSSSSYMIERVLESAERREGVLDGRLNAIGKPTLIVWGRYDEIIPLARADRFHNDIKDSTVVVIDDAGHVPMLERPGEFNSAVIDFLSK